jgi:hypothetical protein
VPIIVFLGAKRGAGRVIVDRPIIDEPRIAADAPGALKLTAATQINNSMRFVFIGNFAFLLIAHRHGR